MAQQEWERVIELIAIGIVVFIGFVSLFYSWIDSAFGITVNIFALTAIAIAASFLVVYSIHVFDPRS